MIALISHDAGGAEILSSYARRSGEAFVYALDGPARKIFRRKLGDVPVLSPEDAVRRASSLVCGTSWQSDIEVSAIGQARAEGKRTVAFLDHWVNYRERFERAGKLILPDEIWVGDAWAETMAKSIFSDIPINLVDNPYWLDVRQELASIESIQKPRVEGCSVLYICEPIGEHALLRYGDAHFWGYTEHEALRYFLDNLGRLGASVDSILLRPHPSEPTDKYAWVATEYDLPIKIGGMDTLLNEIAGSEYVAGCESMALVIALIAGKKVVSSVPPGGRACVLPHDEIIHLRDFVNADC